MRLGVAQIHSMVSVEDAIAVAALDADHVSMMVSKRAIPYTVDIDLGGRICSSRMGQSICVALPIFYDPMEILDLALRDITQIASYEEHLPRDRYMEVFSVLGIHGIKVFKPIPAGLGRNFEASIFCSKYSDYMLLETCEEPPSPLLIGFIGGAGSIRVLSTSGEIAMSIAKPTILAGGLNPDNAATENIIVRPQVVDAATSLDIAGSKSRKDLSSNRSFMKNVRGGFNEIL